MAKRYKRLLGRINNEKENLVGYVVLTVDEDRNINSADPRSVDEVKTLLDGGVIIDNVVIKDGCLRGTEGSLDRLPIFSTNGVLLSIQKYTILNRIKGKTNADTTGFLVMDSFGKKVPLSYSKVLELMEVPDRVTNAKVVPKEGKRVISAIKGEFEVIEITELRRIVPENMNKDKSESQDKPSIKKFRPRKYLWEMVENNICYDRKSDCYPHDTVKLIKDCNDGAVTIGSVSAVQGLFAKRYNSLITLRIMCLSTAYKPITAGDALSSFMDSQANDYNYKFHQLVSMKKNHNEIIHTLREKQTVLATGDADKLVERKNAGGYLTSAEFKLYYAVTHGEDIAGFLGIDRLKDRLRKSKENIGSYQSRYFPIEKGDLLSSDLPFFNEYIRRGKLDFVLKYAQDLECYKNKIKTKADLKQHLDALFIIAVSTSLAPRSSSVAEEIRKQAHSTYDIKFKEELLAIQNGELKFK